MRNSENSRARNEGYFHWLKAIDDDIFVVRYSNYSRPTGSLFTKSEISAKSAKPTSFCIPMQVAYFRISVYSKAIILEFISNHFGPTPSLHGLHCVLFLP